MNKLATNSKLTSYQFFVLVVLPSFSSAIMVLTTFLTESVSADGWISLLLTGIGAMCGVALILSLAKRFPNSTIYVYSKQLCGRYVGSVINFIYISYSLMLTVSVLRFFFTLMYSIAFRETPELILMIMYLLSAVYMSTKNEVVIGRVAEVWFLVLMVMVITIPFLNHNINFDFLRPIASSGIVDLLKSILPGQILFLNLYSIFIFYPFIHKQQKALRVAVTGVGFSTLVHLIYYVLIVGYFGPARTKMFFWPILKYLSIISTPILERFDVISIMLWQGVLLMTVYISFYSAKVGLIETLGLKRSKKHYPIIVVLFLISLYLSQVPRNYNDILNWHKTLSLVSIAINYGIPMFLLFLAVLFKGRKRNEE